ncbi:MAG: Mov34/MPN/PAD-1 family protein [Candidatus Heimdallarchaeota archaeon]|nr:Mov34/MPN/PAD-1 family protein [Candidatus Heimdallarchaeota archaeon]MDH5645688.1 Mov34/MPN/PAD-1 family protein [Candidatus Heimdallarchaeota archaeon]
MNQASNPENIQITIKAMAEIIKYDLSQKGKETAGLLIGSEKNNIVYIDEIRIGEQKGNAVHVEISEYELTQAAIEVSERKDGKVIVGWWHSHPGLTTFLSATDIKTQSIYQSLMPNAVAIVVDANKYGETMNYQDLDFSIFRVHNGNAVQYKHMITDTVNFGLHTYISGISEVKVHSGKPSKKYHPVLSKEKLEKLKLNFQLVEESLNNEDKSAIHSWINLAEALQDGSIQEVPIEVTNLSEKLSYSLLELTGMIEEYNILLQNKQAIWGLFAIICGIGLELLIYILFFL